MVLPRTSLIRLTASLAGDAYQALGFQLILLFVFMLASAICEGVVLAMLLPLFGTMGLTATGGSATTITSSFERIFAALDVPWTTGSIGALLLVLLAAAATIFLAQAFLRTRVEAHYVAHWQRRVFAAVTRAGWPYLRRQRGADVLGALTTESVRLGSAFYQLNLLATSGTFVAMQIAIAALIAPAVTVAMLLLAVALFAITKEMVRRSLDLGTQLTVANADLVATGGEMMSAIKLIKATAREALANQQLGRCVDRIEVLSFRNSFDVQIVRGIFEYASAAALAILLFGAPLLLGIDVVSVLIVMAIFVRLFPKVTGLRHCVQSISQALPAYDALRTIVEKATAAHELAGTTQPPERTVPAGLALQRVSVRGKSGEGVLDAVSPRRFARCIRRNCWPDGCRQDDVDRLRPWPHHTSFRGRAGRWRAAALDRTARMAPLDRLPRPGSGAVQRDSPRQHRVGSRRCRRRRTARGTGRSRRIVRAAAAAGA